MAEPQAAVLSGTTNGASVELSPAAIACLVVGSVLVAVMLVLSLLFVAYWRNTNRLRIQGTVDEILADTRKRQSTEV